MNIDAKYFGVVTYEENETIIIPNGLFGFESYTKYLPISFNEDDDSMISLQSVENPELSFVLFNPFKIFPDYNPMISKQDLKDLETTNPEELSFFVISVIQDSFLDSTLNLKAPLAINTNTRKAKQVILEQSEYTFRHTIRSLSKEEE